MKLQKYNNYLAIDCSNDNQCIYLNLKEVGGERARGQSRSDVLLHRCVEFIVGQRGITGQRVKAFQGSSENVG